jgi:long-chain acyl-CoA synthetase
MPLQWPLTEASAKTYAPCMSYPSENELVFQRHFLRSAEQFGPEVALHEGDFHATFAEHASRALRLADAIGSAEGLGTPRNQRLAVLAMNGTRYIEIYHACLIGGWTVCPLNIRLNPKELAAMLVDADPAAVFVDSTMAPLLDQALSQLEPGNAGSLREHLAIVAIDGELEGKALSYEELLSSGREVVPVEPGEEELALLLYTGGTEGNPRGVMGSQKNLSLAIYHMALSGGVATHRGEVFLHHTPMFHATALGAVLSSYAFGVESVVLPRFDPSAFMATIEHYQVTETVTVPVMLSMLLRHPEFKPERLASLKLLGYGASPMPESLMNQVLEIFPHLAFIQGYGMSESCGGPVTILNPAEHSLGPDVLRSVGRAPAGVTLEILDESGDPLPQGQVGEICVRSGHMMVGYWRQEEATKRAFQGGWYHSGDLGYKDPAGFVHLVDRAKDMIITGGENVYSIEVEHVISLHPAVMQVAVIGVPDEVLGERVHAIVVPLPGALLNERVIQDHVRASLAGYKVPKTVEIRQEPLPLSGAMKPLKRQLREEYLSRTTQ